MAIVTVRARAYMNLGRWIADCPRQLCGNAIALEPKQAMFLCSPGGCNLMTEVEWPPDVVELDAALAERPVPGTRNWAPAGHRQAVSCGFPDGQTLSDIIVESHENGDESA